MSNLGGMQRVATELRNALEEREDVELRTLALRSSWKSVHLRAPSFLLSLAATLRRHARRAAADAILFTSITSALPLVLAGRGLRADGVRSAAIAHGLDVTDPHPLYQWGVREACRRLDAVMPVSRATARELIARGMSPDRVHVVPNAVDLARFSQADRRDEPGPCDADRPTLPKEAFLVLAVGRQVRRKGFSWFVTQVMPQLPERVVLWMVGDGPERPAIEVAIAEQGLGQRVRCLGRVGESELVACYRRADVFVMPNVDVPGDMEGFGIVMLEAGACGVPTVASDLEGIRDVIEDGVNGWLCSSGDPQAFAERIATLANDPQELAAARERTASYVRSTFRWSRSAERYIDVIRNLGVV